MNKIRVCIDPGHGGTGCHNVGASGKYYEHIGMLQLSLMLRDELLSTGAFEIILTRDKDMTLSLYQRAKIAANFKADLFISEHSNAGGITATGAEALCSVRRLQDVAFGQQIAQAVANTLGIPCRKVVLRESEKVKGVDYYGILRYGVQFNIPHVFIIESAFHSNPKEEQMLLNPNILRKIAQAQAQVICNFYKVQYSVQKQQPTPNSTPQPQRLKPIGTAEVITSTLSCVAQPSNSAIRNGLLRLGAKVNVYAFSQDKKWILVNAVNPQWISANPKYVKINLI